MEVSIDFLHLLQAGKVRVSRLTDDYTLQCFDCGYSDLNDFLFNDSKIHLRHLRYTTTLLETENRTIAYYSLANDLLVIKDYEDFRQEMDSFSDTCIEPDYREQFFEQAMYPAVKIGRLAVDVDFQSRGVGSFILNSLVESFTVNNKTGCQFITVDALNDHKEQRAIRFYERHGFNLLTLSDMGSNSRAMYRPLLG
jgi:ribosomal protein S18 acetylase RimI-like enzyme